MPRIIENADEIIFNYIKQYHAQHGYMPSFREISDNTGIKSTSTVKIHMDRLFDHGHLETDLDMETLSPRGFRLGEKTSD